MRDSQNVFHLAVPTHDLDLAIDFYVHQLGCKLARRYDDRVTLDFFGDQLVCHLAPEHRVEEPEMYPRHFGITFRTAEEFDRLLKLASERKMKFFCDPFSRFEGMVEEHRTFFLQDPTGNLLEFKHYADPHLMY